MPSTFFGLTIASSGLSAFQSAVNTTANNISNVDTKGYTRQEAIKQAAQALRVNAKYGTAGSGVEVTTINQTRDQYYDMKYWANQCKLGEYESKKYYLDQVETLFLDNDKVTGFSTIFGDMFDALDTLKTDASSLTSRNSFISGAKKLTDYFNSVSGQLTSLQEDINGVIGTKIANINSISQKIASLNTQINIIEQQGSKANELRDQRALLVDELSKMVPITTEETDVVNTNFPDMKTGATNYVVKINGQTLVNTFEYRSLTCKARTQDQKVNETDVDGLYDVFWTDTGNEMNVYANTMTGELKGLFELRDGNNNSNFSGKLDRVENGIKNGKSISILTITNPSISDPSQLNLPSSGTITLKNKDFTYSDYRMIQAADGTVSYEFDLTQEMNSADAGSFTGEDVKVGEGIGFMGVAYYQSQLNEFVRNFAKIYNDTILDTSQNGTNPGVDLKGNTSGVFFVSEDEINGGEYDYSSHQATESGGKKIYGSNYYYLKLSADNFTIDPDVISDPSMLATATKTAFANGTDSNDLVVKLQKLESGTTVFRGGTSDSFLQCLLSDISVDTQKVEIFKDNYSNLSKAITNQRMSVSSVDKDEEALDLVKFQNAYNLSSKMVQVMSEMYDRLITQTGV